MNPIGEYALAALGRARNANQYDEIPGEGPKWACERFGEHGHNSVTCISCITNFMTGKEVTK